MKYTDDILQNCTLETYILLLINATQVNLIKFLKIKIKENLGSKEGVRNEKKSISTRKSIYVKAQRYEPKGATITEFRTDAL